MASKLKYDDIKQDIESIGWKLISTEYINLKTDLQVNCPEGHLCFVPYDKLRKHNYQCPICAQNQYYKTDDIAIKKEGYRILGFDQASITSGWAVFDGVKLIKYGKWTSQGTHSTERIAQTKYWVASMIEKWRPDCIALEDIQLQTIGGQEAVLTFKKLAHLQGVLKNYAYEKKIPYEVIPVATWRNYSNVKGKYRSDKKKSAQLIVKKLYDVSVTQDEADAVLLTAYAAHSHNANKIIEF